MYPIPGSRGYLTGLGTVAGDVTFTGRVTGAGFSSSILGSPTTPAYNWTSRTGDGFYNEAIRVAVGFGGTDKAYWGSLNHNYQIINGAASATLTGLLQSNGLVQARAAKTANYTATLNDFFIACDSTSGAFTIALPAAASSTGTIFAIKKTVASANAVTIDPNAAELINGAATLVVADNTTAMIICDGTGWLTLSAS